MDILSLNSKEFEKLVTEYDPYYRDMIIGIDIVKKFIIEKKLIIYGGTAIDMALRLKGDRIYPDDLLPDLDFYSTNSVKDSYVLADKLFDAGFHEARAINALHTGTMRVDLVKNHFIADISYREQSVFDNIPYLIYQEMKILHPDFQRIDLHYSLSFPLDKVPREIIFERWDKDIKRFNLFEKHYPLELSNVSHQLKKNIYFIRKHVVSGFAAYCAYYNEFKQKFAESTNNSGSTTFKFDEIVPGIFEFDGERITFSGLNEYEVIHYDIRKFLEEFPLDLVKYYEPYINLIPDRAEGMSPDGKIVVYSTQKRMIGVKTLKTINGLIRIQCVQSLLRQFLSLHFIHKETPKLAGIYINCYISLLRMANEVAAIITNPEEFNKTLFSLSLDLYGSENINPHTEVWYQKLLYEIGDTSSPVKVPYGYYPSRNKGKYINFNPEENKFYRESGREIKELY